MNASDLKFCPQCGSAAVDFSALAGGAAKCRGCGWAGTCDDLLTVPIGGNFLDGSMVVGMMNDLRNLISGELGVPYLKFLIRWGFLQADVARLRDTLDRKKFARYVAAIARSLLIAIVEERVKIEVESVSSSGGTDGG